MSLNRRHFVGAAPALMGAAAASTGTSALAQTTATPASTPNFYRYKVGDAELTAVHEGTVPRPLDASFVRNAPLDQVQAALDKAFLPADRLNITFTPLLVTTGGKRVLIDTGFGDNGPGTTGGLYRGLPGAGIDPKAVDVVLMSHFHIDHIAGLRLKNGELAYPNAEIMVPEAEYAFWMDDAKMSAAPEGLKPNFGVVRRALNGTKPTMYGDGKEIAPGLTAVSTPGHTPGHTSYVLASGGAKLFIMSDITNHPALFVRNPDWSAVFDMDADQARATRHRVLDMVAADKLQVAFYHAPFPATGHVAKAGSGYEFVPVQWGMPA